VAADQTHSKRGLAWAALLVVTVFLLLGVGQWLDTPTLAQAVPPLDIAKSASPDPVLAGEELTYTLTVTNTGRAPLADVVVRDRLPDSTFMRNWVALDGQWMGLAPNAGGTGEIVFQATKPLSPGQPYRLRFSVVVHPAAQGAIVNAKYEAAVGVEGVAVQGEPVIVQALRPTATPTSTSTPAATTGTAATVGPSATPGVTEPPPTASPTPSPAGGCLPGSAALTGLALSLVYAPLISSHLRSRDGRGQSPVSAFGQPESEHPPTELPEEERS
jgi:uncharacterized repeat protein (TIGR01451 family)